MCYLLDGFGDLSKRVHTEGEQTDAEMIHAARLGVPRLLVQLHDVCGCIFFFTISLTYIDYLVGTVQSCASIAIREWNYMSNHGNTLFLLGLVRLLLSSNLLVVDGHRQPQVSWVLK